MKRTLALLTALTFAGCSGGGGTPAALPGSTPTAAPLAPLSLSLAIARDTGAANNLRRPAFIAATTNGVSIQVFAHADTAHANALANNAFDVSNASTLCTTTGGTEHCSFVLNVQPGDDDIVVTTYDQTPAAGAFGSTAHVLATGALHGTIAQNATNTFSIALGGLDTAVRIGTAAAILGGKTAAFAVPVTALDAAGDTIVAGTADPYATPVTVSVRESGGTGHTSLTLGGATGTGSGSVQLTQSAQVVTVLYDGAAQPGYSAAITAGLSSTTTASTTVAPFFVTSTAANVAGGTVTFAQPALTAPIALAEAGFSGTFSATADPTCSGIATVSSPAAGAASAATIGATSTPGTCTITFSDGRQSQVLTVRSTFAIPIAGVQIAPAIVNVLGARATTTPLTVTALDANANPIGGATTPYAAPLVVSVSETGGTGHTTLALAGASGSASVSIAQPSQTVTLVYDGAAQPGYAATVTVTAAGKTASAQMPPFFLIASASNVSGNTVAFTQPGQVAFLSLSEAGFSGAFTATPDPSCGGIATATQPQSIAATLRAPAVLQVGVTQSAVTAGATPGTCTIAFSDGRQSQVLTIQNLFSATTTITIPAFP